MPASGSSALPAASAETQRFRQYRQIPRIVPKLDRRLVTTIYVRLTGYSEMRSNAPWCPSITAHPPHSVKDFQKERGMVVQKVFQKLAEALAARKGPRHMISPQVNKSSF